MCTHRLPNIQQYIEIDHEWKFEKDDIWQVQANKDMTVLATLCKNADLTKCESEPVEGKWKISEGYGFSVSLSNGLNLISSMVYYLPKKFKLSQSSSPKTINCDKTMMGFVVDAAMEEKGTMKKHPV